MKHKCSRIVTLIVLSSLVLGGVAEAKPKKRAKADAGANASVHSEESVEGALRFRPGDESGNELKALKTEMLVIKSEKRALAEILRLQKKYKGTPMEPEILFRLAELYMRRARSHRFFEVHKGSDQVMSFVPTLVKEASEAKEIRKAISIYQELQTRFPDYRNMDVVIFNTAYAYQQLADDKRAEAAFARITTEFPRSILVPDSFLAIGEINYNRRQFAKALENFHAVRKYPQARVFPYGLYKAAWCYYNMQDAQSGLRQLEEVVKFGREVAEQKRDSKLDLRKEALNDMMLFYSDAMPAAKAVEYVLAQSAGLDPAPVIIRLADLYDHHSRFADVEVVLQGMLSKIDKSPSHSVVHERLVWNYEKMRARPKAVVQMIDMNKHCKQMPADPAPGSKAARAQAAAQEQNNSGSDVQLPPKSDCLARIADVSKKLATKWHGLWKKKQPTEELAAASEQAYKLYLENGAAASDPELAQIRYQYGEILFQRKNYREASTQYALVQDSKPDAKLSHEAAYAAIVSLEKATDNKWNDADEKLFVKLSDVYLIKHSKGQWALDLQFKRAFIAYEKERYDEAGVGFKKIGWSTPVTDQSRERVLKSQDLYLDILNVKKDFTNLKVAAQSLVQKGIGDATRLTAVEKIYREAYFAEIQQSEEKGDLKGAVAAYKKFALDNKTSELSSKAWWNASQLQFKMGDAQGGAETCYQMHTHFPKSSNAKDCLTKAAQTYEAAAQLEPAARVLLSLADVEETNQNKWRELSADFSALSGGRRRAVDAYLKLAEKEKPSRQLALFEKILALEKLENNTKGVRTIQDKIVALGLEPSTSEIQMEHAEALFERGQLADAFQASRKVLGRGATKELQARARMLQARVLEDEFRKQSVKSRVERIAMVLGLKTEKLEKAQRAYQEAIKYGDPKVSVQSMRYLADCYHHYSKSVREMELPSTLTEQEREALKAELDGLVIPMEEKGLDTLNQALQAARKFDLHDGSIAEIQSDMNKMNMKSSGSMPAELKPPPIVLPGFSTALLGVGL
ncbi:MAG: tetratricopeptide repeat protein [Bdellovibrionaceae bacterium]|nr:tetratricopeptide repeat protein [Pseudobdellovibrionaceae bacterium]